MFSPHSRRNWTNSGAAVVGAAGVVSDAALAALQEIMTVARRGVVAPVVLNVCFRLSDSLSWSASCHSAT